jgi:hypothetical protein
MDEADVRGNKSNPIDREKLRKPETPVECFFSRLPG